MNPSKDSIETIENSEPSPQDRIRLLLAMYNQLFNDINRHITVIWQAVAVLAGSLAALYLLEKNIIPPFIAFSLLFLIGFWLWAHVLDASYWYNRNLAIIANIEKQFLKASDKHDIHFYFAGHRENNKMITHLRIQKFLALGFIDIFLVAYLLLGIELIPIPQQQLSLSGYLRNYWIDIIKLLFPIELQNKTEVRK